MNLGPAQLLIRQSNGSITLVFRQRRPPCRFRRFFSLRIPRPVAITWQTLVISPTISNMAPFTEAAQLLLRQRKGQRGLRQRGWRPLGGCGNSLSSPRPWSLAAGRFLPPLGYLNAPKWSNASLVHDPERAGTRQAGVRGLCERPVYEAGGAGAGHRGRVAQPRGLVLSPRKASGRCWKCTLYIGVINSPQYGVSTRGNFEALVSVSIDVLFHASEALRLDEAFL